jgi:RNA polymerase sigma-70 factor (ECF subfamily)
MSAQSLEPPFLASCELPPEARAGLGEALEELWMRGRQAHAGVTLDAADFAAALGAAVSDQDDPRAALASVHAVDLYLAVACAKGDAAAIAILEREQLGGARAAFLRLLGPGEADDALQALREKLLIASEGAPPKIGDYSGRGTLAGWIKVVAVRIALSAMRGRKPEAVVDQDDVLLELPTTLPGEPEPLRRHYGAAFKAAFQAALASLEPRERLLLRLQFVDELTVDQIGALYGVHRATAARWVARAREKLFDETRKRLAMELGLPAEQLSSILDIVRSHVDVSLLRVLGQSDGAQAV